MKKLVLNRFSQEISLANPQDIEYYLVVEDSETGQEHRVRVQKETTEDLINIMYGSESDNEEPAQEERELDIPYEAKNQIEDSVPEDSTPENTMYRIEVPDEEELQSI